MLITKLNTETKETYNKETGLIETQYTETATTHSEKTAEPDFIKLYLDHLAIYNNMPLNVNPILAELLRRTSYAGDPTGGHQIVINRAIKKQISAKLNCSESSINNALTVFVNKNYLKRIDRGLYEINPNYFGKGDWGNIKRLRATYDYIENTITTDIFSEDDCAAQQITIPETAAPSKDEAV